MQRSPLEMVFELDCSGSMADRPREPASADVAHASQKLTPRDTSQITHFRSTASQLGTAPLIATPKDIQRSLSDLNFIHSDGDNEMVQGRLLV